MSKTCFHCGTTLTKKKNKPTKDHYIPKARGGWHGGLNVVLSCESCNNSFGCNLKALPADCEIYEYNYGKKTGLIALRVKDGSLVAMNGIVVSEEILLRIRKMSFPIKWKASPCLSKEG